MMGLGWSAVTMAGHISIILTVVILLVNALVGLIRRGNLALTPGVQFGVCAIASAIIVERSYYVVARLTINLGFDLWEKHPAPEILSVLVAVALMLCSASLLRSALPTATYRVWIASQCGFVLLIFLTVASVFW